MKIGVIGAGNVGVGIVDALTYLGIGKEIIFYNRKVDKAIGEMYDLNDAVPLLNGNTEIKATDKLEDLKGCEVIAITVGAKQKPGDTRLDLLDKNNKIIIELIKKLDKIDLKSKIIIVTNPVDVLTRIALKVTKRDKNLLFGSGTVLDTIRLKEELGLRLKINRKNIHSYVIGEHGDSEFVLWSVLNIGPVKIDDFNIKDFNKMKEEIMEKVRRRAYSIIEKKGFTKQAIGVAVANVIKAILYDEKRIFTLSTKLVKNCKDISSQVVLSQPCVVGKNGIEKILLFECDKKEMKLLQKSAKKLDESYKKIYNT